MNRSKRLRRLKDFLKTFPSENEGEKDDEGNESDIGSSNIGGKKIKRTFSESWLRKYAGLVFTKGIKLKLSRKSAQVYNCFFQTGADFCLNLTLIPFVNTAPG